MNFFEMLVMSKKMSLEDGNVSLYGQKILVFPAPSIIHYISMLGGDDSKELYGMVKQSMLENKQDLMKAYKSSGNLDWAINTINLYGLGKVTIRSRAAPYSIVLENSPFVNQCRGKVKTQIDHVMRGTLAGIFSAILDADFDAIELGCAVTSGNSCEFLLDSIENLQKSYPELSNQQLHQKSALA